MRPGRTPKDKAFVAEERRKMVFRWLALGFRKVDVAEMVNAHPSYVSRILAEHADEYAEIFKRVSENK